MHSLPPVSERLRTTQIALNQHLEQRSLSDVAQQLGRAHTTIARREGDLGQYPATEFLAMAAEDPRLADAVVAVVRPRYAGDTLHLSTDLQVSLLDAGKLISDIGEALQAKVFTSAALRTDMATLRRHMDRIEADLDARDAAQARRGA